MRACVSSLDDPRKDPTGTGVLQFLRGKGRRRTGVDRSVVVPVRCATTPLQGTRVFAGGDTVPPTHEVLPLPLYFPRESPARDVWRDQGCDHPRDVTGAPSWEPGSCDPEGPSRSLARRITGLVPATSVWTRP